MKKLYFLPIFLLIGLFSVRSVTAQQSVLDPNDPIVNYDPNNPPALPASAGTMVKWVRTPTVGWNTTPYKSYFYSTSSYGGLAFRLLFPKSYGTDPNKKYPMLIFLHGAGEISKKGLYDNELQLVNCGQKIMNEVLNGNFDGFVLYPQVEQGYWPTAFPPIIGIIKYMAQYSHLDKSRITVSGLSMGGTGTWQFMKSYPGLIAGATPISAADIGDKKISVVDSLQSIPIWISQGGLDRAPYPYVTEDLVGYLRAHRVDVRYTLYPNKGHGVWNAHYDEPDAFSWMLQVNKTNPHVYSGQTEFCIGQSFRDTLSLTTGFEAYQWSRNGVVIPGADSNILIVTDTGTYAARYKMDGEWTYWSPAPVKISYKAFTQTPDIKVSGLMSRVIPAPDGNTSVTLALPPGYTDYQWRNSKGQVIGTDSLYTATKPGSYVATVTQISGCPAKPSDSFHVASSNGPLPPDPASGLTGFVLSQTSVELEWSNNPNPVNNETAFEIYRSTHAGGPYTMAGIVPTDTLSYIDHDLTSNTEYFYVVRAIDQTGAAPVSGEIHVATLVDNEAPTAPEGLNVVSTTPSTVTLTWDASTDNVSVQNYGIYINGVRSYVTSDNVYTVPNLIHGQSYAFTVKAFDPSGNISPASSQIIAAAAYDGLSYKAYTYLGSWPSLPNLSTLTAVDSGIINNVSLSRAPQPNNYALSFRGYIHISQTGTYTFYTNSDDGSNLYVNNVKVVNNDGLHGTREESASYTFDSPGWYPFGVDFYQEGGSAVLTVSWQKSGSQGFSKSKIPDSVFTEKVISGGAAPIFPTGITATALAYDSIKLRWQDKSANESGFEIYRSVQSDGPYQIIATTKKDSVAYLDTLVAPSTTYYYKIQAINEYGSSGYDPQSSNVHVTTPGLPPAPLAPSGLDAMTISLDKIRLTWGGQSGNNTGFELFRSIGNNTDYRKIAQLPVGSLSYVDSLLYSNTVYYYKLKAIGTGGASDFSNEANAVTGNHAPQISADTGYYVRYGKSSDITLNAADRDNEVLSLTASNLPSFGSFHDNGNGTGTFTFSPTESEQGSYSTIKIVAMDQHGGKDSATFNLTVGNVNPPVIQPVEPISANTFELTLDTIRLMSGTGHGTSWQTPGKPGFVNTDITTDGNLILKVAPGADDAGTYTFQIIATNNLGMSDTKNITVTVDMVSLKSWYLNFASSDSYRSYPETPWNNIRGDVTTNLNDNEGQSTGVGLALQTDWWKVETKGAQTGDNSGLYPDNVLRDNYYFGRLGGPNVVTGKITGLDPGKGYSITFFASSIWGFTGNNGHTVFQIGTQKDSVNVQGNTNNAVIFSNLTPASDGSISFIMSKGKDAGAGYLNALVVTTLASAPPARPTDLQLSNTTVNGANAVKVNWQSGSANASTIEVYRSTQRNGAYTLLNDGLDNGNASLYTDTTVASTSSVTYYYYLIASNAYGHSAATDTASITTSQYVDTRSWYMNFAAKETWRSYPETPWNNIRGDVTTDLKDNNGQSSGVGLTFETSWWAVNTTGAQTGDNSGIYPDNVLRDNFYFGRLGGPDVVTGKVTGLDPAKNYALTFFASSTWRFVSDNGHTVFQVGTQKDSIDVEGNTDKALTIGGLTPASDGSISFTMSKGKDAGAGYLNALVVTTLASAPPARPTDLQLSNTIVNGGNAVKVNWQSGSANASTIEVYRSTQRNGAYTLLNDGLDNGNASLYTDTTVAPTSSVTYYYYLIASNAYGHSAATDTASITTSQYVDTRSWYMNFAAKETWRSYPGSPWNNIRADVTTDLKDNNGQSSNVGLALETSWWAVNTTGAQTGDNSGIYPDNVLRDNFYFGRLGGPDVVTGKVTGLDPAKSYVLTFFASSTWRFVSDNGHTVFQVGTQKDSIDVEGNTDKALTIGGVTPASDGTISFTMSKGKDAGAGYLNALVVRTMADITPAAPVNLQLTNVISNEKNAVKVNWQPGSNNTDTISIYRASNEAGPYTVLNPGQSNMDRTSLLDTNVAPLSAATYYYYLVASNDYGRSAPSDTMHITTVDLLPKTPSDLGLSRRVIDYEYTVAVSWKLASDNIKQIDIYRSTQDGEFSLLASLPGDDGAASYIDNEVTLGTSYHYYLIAKNEYGSSPATNTVSITLPNTPPATPPVISEIPETNVVAGTADSLQVSATASGGTVAFILVNAPTFVSLQDAGNNTAKIVFRPAISDVGEYDSLKVVATDPDGGSDTAYLSLNITDGNLLSKIYLNFTPINYTYHHNWNNIVFNTGNNVMYADLINGTGKQTGVNLTTINAWSGFQTDGANTYNNSGFVPDSVMAAGYYISDATSRTMKISGLSTSKKYNLIFFASSNNGGDSDYTANYSVSGKTVSLNGIRNTSNVARINGLIPASDGSLTVAITKTSAAYRGLLNAMEIEVADTNALVAPTGLRATAGEDRVSLNWIDRSDNEQQFKVFRAVALNGPYAVIRTLGANTTSFTDNNVSPDKRYFYKVTAVSINGDTISSEVASATTPKLAVYINFNLLEAPAPAPWNNTQIIPQPGDIYGPLTDSKGNNTGITLNMGANFEGESTDGLNTGDNSGIYPDLVTSSSYYLDNGVDTAVMQVSNLNLSMKYNLTFYGSIFGSGWQNTTQYIVNDQIAALEASYNVNNTVTLSNLSPNQNGQIVVKIIYTKASSYAVLNAMIIQCHNNYDDQGNKVVDPTLIMRAYKWYKTDINSKFKGLDDSTTAKSLKLIDNVYPNPFHDQVNIKLNSPRDGKLDLFLYGAGGKLLDGSQKTLSKGINHIQYQPDTDLQPGLYIITMRLAGTQQMINVKLVKQ